MFYNENGEQKLYTRGDGVTGQDISHMVPYLPQLEKINQRKSLFAANLFSQKAFSRKNMQNILKMLAILHQEL